jgi:hypothetical protein
MHHNGNKGKRGKNPNVPINQVIVIDNDTGEKAKTKTWWTHRRVFDDAQQLETLGREYIEAWEAERRPLTMIGLILYLGVNRSTFAKYLNGDYDEIDPNFSNTCATLKGYIEMQKFEKALRGEYVAQVAMFDLRFNHGYKDEAEKEKPVKSLADIDDSDLTAEQAFLIWKEELKKIEK